MSSWIQFVILSFNDSNRFDSVSFQDSDVAFLSISLLSLMQVLNLWHSFRTSSIFREDRQAHSPFDWVSPSDKQCRLSLFFLLFAFRNVKLLLFTSVVVVVSAVIFKSHTPVAASTWEKKQPADESSPRLSYLNILNFLSSPIVRFSRSRVDIQRYQLLKRNTATCVRASVRESLHIPIFF